MPCQCQLMICAAAILALGCGGAIQPPCAPGQHRDEKGTCVADVVACADGCEPGVSRCAEGGRQTCAATPDGCGAWAAPLACANDQACSSGRCVGCTGVAGAAHDQPFTAPDNELRHYFAYAPAGFDCTARWPLLIDLHGTALASEADHPEEFYALPDLEAAAEALGFVAVRPRSRSQAEDGSSIYRWDQNLGDVPRNAAFLKSLVKELIARYHADPARVYVAGFSSGTNMASALLGGGDFHGFAFIGGGFWSATPSPPAAGARIYSTTGYRDYLLSTQRDLLAALAAQGFAADRLWVRASDSGHELYGWHYRELWPWLDGGQKPAPGALAASWSRLPSPGGGDDLVSLALAPDGRLFAGDAAGGLWSRDGAGWTERLRLDGSPALTGLCFTSAGGLAVGGGRLARSFDGGGTWAESPAVPEFGRSDFGNGSYLVALACDANSGSTIGGGYWEAALSKDDGTSWSASQIPGAPGASFRAQLATLARGPSGAWVAAGYYNYLGRSADGLSFAPAAVEGTRQWINGLAALPGGNWIAVGEAGTILASSDDGASWAQVASPRSEDLYAVAFADARRGLAVGAHGAALATHDGGATWRDVSTGLDAYLGAVVFDDLGAVAAGEGGAVLRLELSVF